MDGSIHSLPMTELILDDGRIEAMDEHLSPEELYQDLIDRVQKYHPSDDISLIEKAYQVARDAHTDRLRRSGEPYIIHPLCVAIILADLQLEKESIVAGLLHDVVEDTIMTEEEIEKEFGADVALIVDGVTKLERIKYNEDKIEFQADNLRKMLLAMAQPIAPRTAGNSDEAPEAGKADRDRKGNHGYLCAACTASGYFQAESGTG